MQKKVTYYFICGVILFALVLNLIGIKNGFPVSFNPDESIIVKTALRLPVDRMNPHLFFYPALSFYFYLMPCGVLYLVNAVLTWNFSLANFSALFFIKPYLFFLAARIFAALLFSVSIWLCFSALRKMIKSNLVVIGITRC